MKSAITLKSVLLSVLYVILLIVVLDLLNTAIIYFFDELVFPTLNWFNHKALWIKVGVIFFGGLLIILSKQVLHSKAIIC